LGVRSTEPHDRTASDEATLAFYDREAETYAARREAGSSRALAAFLSRLAPCARILELGCGGGQEAEAMIAAGFEVTPTDGSPALARIAEARLGRPVQVMRFNELDAQAEYDGVWASACLLHVPAAGLPDVLGRIHRALRPGGVFHASFKGGEGEGRDDLGRYYNFPRRDELEAAYRAAAAWRELKISEGAGGGYDGVERTWFLVAAVKGDR
jgi:SAM-dependent methyltransferase